MKSNTHRHFAYGFNVVVGLLLLLALLNVNGLKAQDTVSLNVVEVQAAKTTLSQFGKHLQSIDSTTKARFPFSSLADLLSVNSQVYIKTYGPGALASTALRGGNAAQTAILWNGFNLQNAMLGQTDLALLPAMLFEHVDIEYGGSSSLWGSGAMGGSIHLNNQSLFGQGLRTSTRLGAGSFGMKNASAMVLMSGTKFISSTKLYVNQSDNNFSYKDTSEKEHPLKKQSNAAYLFAGFTQEFKYLINSKQLLTLNAWLSVNHKQLPAYASAKENKQFQTDEAMRMSANWSCIQTNYKSVIKAAFFKDGINYRDSIMALYSNSKATTVIVENENYWQWAHKHTFHAGVNVTSSRANVLNYATPRQISKLALMAGNKFSYLKTRLMVYTSLRAEYFSAGQTPVTGNLAAEFKLNSKFLLSVNTAKVYRQPTLNELYWLPGGNVNLKPEQGFTTEACFKSETRSGNYFYGATISVYSRRVTNWIQWVPGAGGNPSPLNVQEVWSRGSETNWKLNFVRRKFKAELLLGTAYVLSTVVSSYQENSASVNRQLIYTPRYTANGSLVLGYGKTNLAFYHQYVGYRFTSSDNTEWLTPYQLSALRLSHVLSFKNLSAALFAACNNVFNTNYTVMVARPMPLQNFEFGISINTKNNLNQKNKKHEN